MSNRTIVEFNHDLWDRIQGDPEAFADAILRMLKQGVNGAPGNKLGVEIERDLRRFGVVTTPTCHHSEVRTVLLGNHSKISF